MHCSEVAIRVNVVISLSGILCDTVIISHKENIRAIELKINEIETHSQLQSCDQLSSLAAYCWTVLGLVLFTDPCLYKPAIQIS